MDNAITSGYKNVSDAFGSSTDGEESSGHHAEHWLVTGQLTGPGNLHDLLSPGFPI